MKTEAEVIILKNSLQKHLENFTKEAKRNNNLSAWRTLYCHLDPDLVCNPRRKDIAVEFLKSVLVDTSEAKAFWLTSGQLFVFFQGPVRMIISRYEHFLEMVDENHDKVEYKFFWEMSRFWGFFDEILIEEIDESKRLVPKKTHTADIIRRKQQPPFKDEDMKRLRRERIKPLLLIVEDDRTTRHFLQSMMERECDIAVAWNVRQASEIYQKIQPNITFLDVQLPDGDGRNLAEIFCAQDPEAFIVIVSGNISNGTILRGKMAGVKGFINKPVKENELMGYITQYHANTKAARS